MYASIVLYLDVADSVVLSKLCWNLQVKEHRKNWRSLGQILGAAGEEPEFSFSSQKQFISFGSLMEFAAR